jgi:hypothetical protein
LFEANISVWYIFEVSMINENITAGDNATLFCCDATGKIQLKVINKSRPGIVSNLNKICNRVFIPFYFVNLWRLQGVCDNCNASKKSHSRM